MEKKFGKIEEFISKSHRLNCTEIFDNIYVFGVKTKFVKMKLLMKFY